MKKKKKFLVVASALALIAIGAGTFAWFTSKDNVKNHFEGEIAGNDIVIVETFVPPTNWKPGDGIKKEAAVQNNAEYNSLIRVSFEEKIEKLLKDNEIRFDGVNYTWTGDNAPATDPTNPVIIPSSADFTSEKQGFTLVAPANYPEFADVKVGDTTYKFNLYEKLTKPAIEAIPESAGVPAQPAVPGEYAYAGQWVSITDPTVKARAYLTNEAGVITRNKDNTAKIEFPVGFQPSISLVDKTYAPAVVKDWVTGAYSATKPTGMGTDKAASLVDTMIELGFKADSINNTTPTPGLWYFNAEDNYFYFIGNVAPGNQTAQLLDSVTLSQNADNSYSLLKYDLNVKAEGIQAMKAAVDTWLPGSTNTALVDALKGVAN